MDRLSATFAIPNQRFYRGGSINEVPGKSMVPLLLASTSLIMSCSSDSAAFCPKDFIAVPSSFIVISPIDICHISSAVSFVEH